MKFPWYILAIDLETTGSVPSKHSICQIGAILISPSFDIIKSNDTLVRPLPGTEFVQEAMDCHHIPREKMETEGVDLTVAIDRLHDMLSDDRIVVQNGRYKNVVLASWANYFDIPFLRAQYDKVSHVWPFGYKSLDFKSIAIWEMAKRNTVIVEGLSTYASRLGLPFDGTPHDALSDIKSARAVLAKLASEA